MSNLREKARAVKAAGEAERSNFNPTGAPKRMYDYWLDNTNSDRGRKIRSGRRTENFCHFWRVVALWGPLMWVRKTISNNLDKIAATLGIIAVVAFVAAFFLVPNFWFHVLVIIGMLLAGASVIGGFVAGVSAALSPEDRLDGDFIRNPKVIAVWAVLGLPTFILGYLFVHLLELIDRFIYQPSKAHPKPAKIIGATVLSLIVLGVAYLIGGTVGILGTVVVVAAIAILITLGIFLAVVVSDYVSGRRVLAAQQAELYYETHGEYPKPAAKKEPSALDRKIDAFFRGIGDFIILIAQVVRVNKWKICPTVEIKTDR